MTATDAPQGEITCLYTDIESAMALRKTLPEAEFLRLLAEANDLLVAVFQETGGAIIARPGEHQFCVVFSLAHEALQCAVTVQERLFEARESLKGEARDGAPRYVQARIGVYTAHSDLFRTQEGSYIEQETNLAVRIGAYGVGGQILVSDRTRALGDTFPEDWWKTHPDRYLRNIDTPETLHELLWDGRTGRPEPGARWMPKFLQRQADRFIGREAERQCILQWLRGDSPLLWLYGPEGIGKTRLAAQAMLAVSSLYRDSIFGIPLDREFLEGAEEVTPLQLAHAIAHSVGAPAEIQTSEKPDALIDYLERRFPSEPFLLMLDNFESVTNAATRAFLADLTGRVSQILCLVTCRDPFPPAAESESLEIVGLRVPENPGDDLAAFESVQLFRERALQQRPAPDLSDTEALVRILRYTEGNPLAIELLAARAQEYACPRIADGLRWSRLDWVPTATESGGVATRNARSSHLEACIEWSFQMLPSDAWRRYPGLGLFPAEFDAQATADIADVSEQDLLRWSRLHLLDWSEETGRAYLPPALREFARRRLSQEALPALQNRFVAYYVRLARNRIKSATRPDVLDAEMHNLRAAAALLCAQENIAPEEAKKLIVLGVALHTMRHGGHSSHRSQAVLCLHTALTVVTEEKYPRQWAQIQHYLGAAHSTLLSQERSRDLRHAIACFRAALSVRTQQRMSREWAMTQFKLGNAYLYLPDGDRQLNVHLAIDCYRAVLQVYTEQSTPKEWADAQHNLGLACAKLPNDDRSLHLLEAIDCYKNALQIYTEPEFPTDWALAQNNLGNAYLNLRLGSHNENIHEALAYYQEALQVFTEPNHPKEWAMVQFNRGVAYAKMPEGDRTDTLRRAIACYQAALQVRTEHDFPREWAATQTNLGSAYFNLPGGNSAENMEQAIACYQASLRVYTETDFPAEWAMTQNNIGAAYSRISEGGRAANLRKAIACYQAALRVRTEQDYPKEWATTQNNMGIAYHSLPGEEEENMVQAVACFHAVLRFRTKQDHPEKWAATQNNLGSAYLALARRNRLPYLHHAVTCYQAALTVHTEQDSPEDWATTQQNLGRALSKAGDREGADQAFRLAIQGYRRAGKEESAQKVEALLSGSSLAQQLRQLSWPQLLRILLRRMFRFR